MAPLGTLGHWGRRFSYLLTTNERQQVRIRKLRARGRGRLVYSVAATSRRDRDQGAGPNHHRLPTRVLPPDRRRSNSTIAGTTLTRNSIYLTLLVQRQGHVAARIARVLR